MSLELSFSWNISFTSRSILKMCHLTASEQQNWADVSINKLLAINIIQIWQFNPLPSVTQYSYSIILAAHESNSTLFGTRDLGLLFFRDMVLDQRLILRYKSSQNICFIKTVHTTLRYVYLNAFLMKDQQIRHAFNAELFPRQISR